MWLAIIIFYFMFLFLVCRFFSVSNGIEKKNVDSNTNKKS
jgi:hypothetical protein